MSDTIRVPHGFNIQLQPPSEPGFYWAKTGSFKWWNVIAEVYGKPPFLKIRGWDRTKDTLFKYDSEDIEGWGPKIEIPE
jgi:hypothetical protein